MGSQATALAIPQRETVSCRVCSASPCTPYLQARGYDIVRCDSCGLRYVNPQPSLNELEQLYTSFDQGDQWRIGEERFNRHVRKVILRFKKVGAALDVGSGSGNFLHCLREAGFDVFGVEPSLTGSTYARSVHGVETFHGTVEGFVALGSVRDFDVVTLLNVLEHLKDPASILGLLRPRLRCGGILVIVVPDARLHALVGETRQRLGFRDPFWMESEGKPLVGFDPPLHLCSFEPRTISQLVQRCGFEAVYLRNAPVIFNDERWKNLAKRVLHALTEAIYWLTLYRVIVGYSTLLVARKA
jgi:SAM-dependent methyltransferase